MALTPAKHFEADVKKLHTTVRGAVYDQLSATYAFALKYQKDDGLIDRWLVDRGLNATRGCAFRRKAATVSNPKRPLIPI